MPQDIKKIIFFVLVIMLGSRNLFTKQCLWRDIEQDVICDDDYDSEKELYDHVWTHIEPVEPDGEVIKCYWAKICGYGESHCGRYFRAKDFDAHIEGHIRRYFNENVTNKTKKIFEEQYYEQEEDQEQDTQDALQVPDEQDARVIKQEQAEQEVRKTDTVKKSPTNIVVERKKKILKRINHDGLPFLCHYPGEKGYICGRSFETLNDFEHHQKKHKRAIRDAGRAGKERDEVKEWIWLD